MALRGGVRTAVLLTATLLVLGGRYAAARRTCFVKIKLDQDKSLTSQWNFPSLRVGSFMGYVPCLRADRLCKRALPQHVTRLMGGGGVNPISGRTEHVLCNRFSKTLPPGHPGHVRVTWKVNGCDKINELYLGRVCCSWVNDMFLPQDVCPAGSYEPASF